MKQGKLFSDLKKNYLKQEYSIVAILSKTKSEKIFLWGTHDHNENDDKVLQIINRF